MLRFEHLPAFTDIVARFGIRATGVIHLGAHLGEEREQYAEAGVKRVLWVEANPELISELTRRVEPFTGHDVHSFLVSDIDGAEQVLQIANFSQSSSVLSLGTHSEHYPGIVLERGIPLRTKRLDTFFREADLNGQDYDFLHADLQGSELAALRGCGALLQHVRWINIEVNVASLYKGCPKLTNIDRYLYQRGFVRVALYLTGSDWGDALYKRTEAASRVSFVKNWSEALILQLIASAAGLLRKLLRRLRNHLKSPIVRLIRG